MPIHYENPSGSNCPVGVDQSVLFRASITNPEKVANVQWLANGVPFDSAKSEVVYKTGSFVNNKDASSNRGVDKITITCKDTKTGVSADVVLDVVQGLPAINCTVEGGPATDSVVAPNVQPSFAPRPGGLVEPDWYAAPNFKWRGKGEGKIEWCSREEVSEGKACECRPKMDEERGNQTASVRAGSSGLVPSRPAFCPTQSVASASKIQAALYGKIQVQSGCGSLATRGERLDLRTTFTSIPDGLASAERIAGPQRRFGWQVRLIQDSAGNVAIYYGDGAVEPWPSADGGSTFSATRGVYGTLTKQGDGSFTRTTKECVYYDFDANGRLQKIKDGSSDGNVIYYNYNGSNQAIRITGPGMGFKPYFTYDANGRVNSMTLEDAANPNRNRVSYYDYDGSGRMNKMIGPEGCLTYFDYDPTGATQNLWKEINPDNYTTYFDYGTESIPRILRVKPPEAQQLDFTYNDGVLPANPHDGQAGDRLSSGSRSETANGEEDRRWHVKHLRRQLSPQTSRGYRTCSRGGASTSNGVTGSPPNCGPRRRSSARGAVTP